ncbi:MAG TPA: glutamine synthetase family protein [Acidimicrobiia bacterium]|nr:glutamine synthetase family protein [Acidimicrobiia bacterium]
MGGPGDPQRARLAAEELAGRGVTGVALSWVDNAGISRVKAVPVRRLADAAVSGVGMSPVFDVFLVDDSITTSAPIGGPVGDLRLYPDLDVLTVLAAQPGWAWAPADRYTQEGEPHPACQRQFAARMTGDAAAAGLEFQMAFEVEWFVGRTGDGAAGPGADAITPGCTGPAYGMSRVVELSDYAVALLRALDEQGVPVDQFHPEYAAGQLELSTAPAPPVAAADRVVLVKDTIRAVSQAHGLRASFAPVVVAGQVGNGGHLHCSAWSEGRNLFAGGDGPHGLTDRGESILAGLLDALPALCAIGAPSVASYLRLVPQRWAGPWQCWGRENREAALRLVTGTAGTEASAANAEIKCFDASANPYLVAGAVTAVAAATAGEDRRLPGEVLVDPATLPPGQQPPRLPGSVGEAVVALEKDGRLRTAMGDALFESFVAVRRAEAELFAARTDEDIAAATRWRY